MRLRAGGPAGGDPTAPAAARPLRPPAGSGADAWMGSGAGAPGGRALAPGSRDRSEELAREIGGVALQADLTVEDGVDRLFEAAEQELGGLDVCAAVAGFWPREDEPVWA